MENDDKLIAAQLGDNNEFLGAIVPPIFMNSLHVFPTMEDYLNHDKTTQYVYGRVANPTVKLVEKKVAALERGEFSAVFSSGMAAATTAIMSTCKTGSHIICLKNCYGPVKTFLDQICVPNLNMEVSYTGATTEEIIEAIRPNTHLIIIESPTSLIFEVVDIKAVTTAAKANGIKTYIDNSYCSPILQKPLTMGIDIVMHTLSKYIGGHSDLIGGTLVCSDPVLAAKIYESRELFGGILGPQEAWLVLRGIRTLEIRVLEHQKTAVKVAEFLELHPKVEKVHYPGLKSSPYFSLAGKQQLGSSGLLSFEIKASKEAAVEVCNALNLFKIGVSWGGFESLVVMPAYKLTATDAANLGTKNNLIRIHCGLDGANNLIADLTQALAII